MSVPKLRFKEFEGNWAIQPLKNICKINQGLQIAIENRFKDEGENRHFYITNEFLKEGAKKSYFIENPPRNVLCDEHDILMTRTGNTGQVVSNVRGAFHNNFFKITFDKTQINKDFFIDFLRKESTQHLILKYAGASTIPDLNHSDFYRIGMPVPLIEEQTKIASFLSAVDEKISLLTKRHGLLSQYKQSMMQKLFSQKIRFKADDGLFGEWKETTLGNIAEIVGGGTPSTNHDEYWKGDVVWLTPSEINKKFIGESKRTISELGVQKCSAKKLPKGTLLFTSRATIGEVSIATKEVTTNQGFQSFIPYSSTNNEFLYYWIIQNKKQFIERASGSTFLEISKTKIQPIKILLPCLEEQIKIASFLSVIDQKIEIVAKQIEQAKQWKKGLLQQMFV